jgi:hypothetical protein
VNKAYVLQSLENLRNVYRSILQADYITEINGSISWANYNPGIIRNSLYIQEYRKLLDDQQFSFLFSDNSFVQFYFNFDDDGILKKAKLAYFPIPRNTKDSIEQLYDDFGDANDWLVDMLVEQIGELSSEDILANTSHIRFDFDSDVTSHYKAHLQFGGVNSFRMSSEKIPLPFTFIGMMFKCFMSPIWQKKSETLQYKNASTFDLEKFFHSQENHIEPLFITSYSP